MCVSEWVQMIALPYALYVRVHVCNNHTAHQVLSNTKRSRELRAPNIRCMHACCGLQAPFRSQLKTVAPANVDGSKPTKRVMVSGDPAVDVPSRGAGGLRVGIAPEDGKWGCERLCAVRYPCACCVDVQSSEELEFKVN